MTVFQRPLPDYFIAALPFHFSHFFFFLTSCITNIYLMYVQVHTVTHMPPHIYGGQGETCGSHCSPSTKWDQSIDLQSIVLAAAAFTRLCLAGHGLGTSNPVSVCYQGRSCNHFKMALLFEHIVYFFSFCRKVIFLRKKKSSYCFFPPSTSSIYYNIPNKYS